MAEAAGQVIAGVGCPSCGGSLEMRDGVSVMKCTFCGTTLMVKGAWGAQKFFVKNEAKKADAESSLRKWWKKFKIAPDLKKIGKIKDMFLVYIPFYRVTADVVGWVFGVKKETRTVGSGKSTRVVTTYKDVERHVNRSFDDTMPALNIGEFGTQRVDLRGDTIIPADINEMQKQGMTFQPTASFSDALEEAQQRFIAAADPSPSLHQVTFRQIDTVRERVSLIYYPLWVLRYGYKGRTYQCVIDGQDHTLSYGKAPGNNLYRALMMVGTMAAATFGASSLLQAMFEASEVDFRIVAAVVVGAGLLIWWGFKKFRYGGEVVEGYGVVKRQKTKKESKLKQAARMAGLPGT
jgi:ribosomal protein L37AE/L43A